MHNIKLVRIDDRLLHGQVVSTWIKDYEIEQAIIVNDELMEDEIAKSVVAIAAPKGVKVLMFGIDKFKEITSKNIIKKSTMLIYTNPLDILRCLENTNLNITDINVGGMRYKTNRNKIYKSVSVTDQEKIDFKKLIEKDINVFIQTVPKDEIIKIETLL